jgi:hypothetical protein
MTTPPLPLPPLDAVLGVPRRAALDAFLRLGWRPWATPLGLDAERRRLLNLDLSEPDVALSRGGEVALVAHLEADLEGTVTHVEVVGAEPVDLRAAAGALLPGVGEPAVAGGADARTFTFGPESGLALRVAGEPVRLWICLEKAYGDRLWAVGTLVRRVEEGE